MTLQELDRFESDLLSLEECSGRNRDNDLGCQSTQENRRASLGHFLFEALTSSLIGYSVTS